ncbi:MAG TPA: MerR family transcriptional regulator [Candidatus Hydrogenedentes bacterium]|nr:MerR family transcriptional regulator [Candidatus Hydrogenedentota bacterium]HPG66814.1 MerR family transcriptional regulator [Candidatus Hydrogenedentota bacterium]
MTIGALARKCGLSRGTLLHYDAIGLLRPSARSDSGYRIYTATDEERLRRICLYRSAGVALADIREMLDAPEPKGYTEVLRRRLATLNEEIVTLKRQQQLIVRLLGRHETDQESTMLNKEQWIALLRATGLSDEDMYRWHQEFEKMSGEAHQEFLESLGIDAEEIKQIRAHSRS